MRLMIYGGTEYATRCRVGEWNIPTEVLSEVYGIPEKDWAIGLGILEGEGFLILKRQQTGTGGRTYPFVILYDPAEETWRKFDWNAAKLAFALLHSENPFVNDLLVHPESFTIEKVAQMTRNLAEFHVHARSQSPITELIAGSFFESEPLSVNPKSLKIALPDRNELAAQLEAAPPFLRAGRGWLLGGHLKHAKALGVGLVFDNFLNTEDARAESVVRNGRRLILNWQSIKDNAEFSETLLSCAQVSPWNFEKTHGHSLSEFLRRAGILADLLKREDISDKEFFDVQKLTGGAFGREIYGLARRLLLFGKKQFSEEMTGFVLDEVSRDARLREEVAAERLNHRVYCDRLVENRIFPSESQIKLNLKADECLNVCQRLIEAEKDNSKIPGLLIKSLEELNRCGGEGFAESLANAAFQKTLVDWHDVWLEYRDEKFFNDYLKTTCRDRARREAKVEAPEWKNTYLRYGDDDGGAWLIKDIGLHRTEQLFNQIKGVLKNNPSSTKSGTK
ncbi:MAG TPA: hypothetical protein VGB00_07335, partial [Pyrinomonadaceae bacterium]